MNFLDLDINRERRSTRNLQKMKGGKMMLWSTRGCCWRWVAGRLRERVRELLVFEEKINLRLGLILGMN